jgi:iron(III) transport system substrate-binding protein
MSLAGHRSVVTGVIAFTALVFAACAPAAPSPTAAPAKPAESKPAATAAPAKPAEALAAKPAEAKPAASPAAAAKPAEAKPALSKAEGPAASPAAKAAEAAKPAADWNAILEAAKREGVVQCACPPRPDYAKLIKDSFEKAVPGIRLEAAPATLPDIWARVEKEQSAGQYLWDVYMFGPTLEMFALKEKGGFAPFREYMVGPDIGDPAAWEGGFDKWFFLDKEKRFVSAFWLNVTTDATINRDVLPNEKITSFADILKPELKGKVVMQDPRGGGQGLSFLTAVYKYLGKDGVKKLLVDQDAGLYRGNQEVSEQVVRGGRGISVASLSEDTLVQFRQAGVKLNLEKINLMDILGASNGGQAPAVFKNAPHPNATKVFVNWMLSKDAQQALADKLKQNSLRKDVKPGDDSKKPPSGADLFHTQLEESFQVAREAQQAARELRPS